MDFKRKLGHGLSALFSSDDEIDREIEKMEKAQASSRDENPFSSDSESFTGTSEHESLVNQGMNPFEQKDSSNVEFDHADADLDSSKEEKTSISSFSDTMNSSEQGAMCNSSSDINFSFGQNLQESTGFDKNASENDKFTNNKPTSESNLSLSNDQGIDTEPESSSSADSFSVGEERTPIEDSIGIQNEYAVPSASDEDGRDAIDPLMKADENLSKDRIQLIDIYKIEPDRQQPRKSFDSVQLSELAASIRQYGVLSPLLVSKEADYYKIIAGERRYRAARMAGLDQLPVIVREFDEQDKMAVALIENIQRQELNPMEEANAYRTLMDKYRMTQEEIAEKLNKSRSSIANLLRLQKLPESVQKSLSEGLISFGHAKVLLGVEDPIDQTRLALQIVSNNLSVRDLEDLVRAGNAGVKKKKQGSKGNGKVQTFSHRLAEDRLKDKLSTKVTVNGGKRKGSISIEFYSQDDLERILSILGI